MGERDIAPRVDNIAPSDSVGSGTAGSGTKALIIASEMKALGALAAMFALAVTVAGPAFAGAPTLNTQKICKTRDTEAKILKSTTGKSIEECVHDEEVAHQQLNSLWDTTSAHFRNQCTSDARALGMMSYLDLLTCLQMAEDMKAESRNENARK